MVVKVQVYASLKRNGKRDMIQAIVDVDSSGNDKTVRQQIEQRLEQRLSHTTLLHAGKQMLWGEVLIEDWFQKKDARLWIFEPEDITLHLKLLLSTEHSSSPSKFEFVKCTEPEVSITVPSGSSARRVRLEILKMLRWSATYLCHGGRMISLFGLESQHYEPFLLSNSLYDGAQLFVMVEPPSLLSDSGDRFGRQQTQANRQQTQAKQAVANTTRKRYVLEEDDLTLSFINIRKRLAQHFGFIVTQTRLLFAGLDLSIDNRTPPFLHAAAGSVVWLCIDKSLMDVLSVVLKIVMWDAEDKHYKCSQFDGKFSKLTTILQMQKNLSNQFDPEKNFSTIPKIFRCGVELKSYKRLMEEVTDSNATVEVVFSGGTHKVEFNKSNTESIDIDETVVEEEPPAIPGGGGMFPPIGGVLEPTEFTVSDYQLSAVRPQSFETVQNGGNPASMQGVKWQVLQDKKSNTWEVLDGSISHDLEVAYVRGSAVMSFASNQLKHNVIFDKYKSDTNLHQLLQTETGRDWQLRRCDERGNPSGSISLLRWEYCDNLDNFVPYNNIIAKKIEQSYQRQEQNFKFQMKTLCYTVSFNKDQPYVTSLQGDRRHVRRYILNCGDAVQLTEYYQALGATGVVRYIGAKKTEEESPTQLRPIVVGIELETARGQNNGTMDGVKYFDECKPLHGVVLPANQAVKVWEELRPLQAERRQSTEIQTSLPEEKEKPRADRYVTVKPAKGSGVLLPTISPPPVIYGSPTQKDPLPDENSSMSLESLDEKYLLQNNMQKKHRNPKLGKRFGSRIFTLTEISLKYVTIYDRKRDKKESGKEEIKSTYQVTDIASVQMLPECQFEVTRNDGDQLIVKADSAKMQQKWHDTIKNLIKKTKTEVLPTNEQQLSASGAPKLSLSFNNGRISFGDESKPQQDSEM